MFFGEKKESSADFLVKLVIFLGAVSAIFVAVALLLKKYHKKIHIDDLSDLDFDDDDFCYDCSDFDEFDDCFCNEDSDNKEDFDNKEDKAEDKNEEASEENTEQTEA